MPSLLRLRHKSVNPIPSFHHLSAGCPDLLLLIQRLPHRPEGAFHSFPFENHDLNLDELTHPSCFTLGCKMSQCWRSWPEDTNRIRSSAWRRSKTQTRHPPIYILALSPWLQFSSVKFNTIAVRTFSIACSCSVYGTASAVVPYQNQLV